MIIIYVGYEKANNNNKRTIELEPDDHITDLSYFSANTEINLLKRNDLIAVNNHNINVADDLMGKLWFIFGKKRSTMSTGNGETFQYLWIKMIRICMLAGSREVEIVYSVQMKDSNVTVCFINNFMEAN